LCLSPVILLLLHCALLSLLLLLFEIAGHAGQLEAGFETLSLAGVHVLLHNVLSVEHLRRLVWDALKLVVFHFAGNRGLFVVLLLILLFLGQLDLNLLRSVVDPRRYELK